MDNIYHVTGNPFVDAGIIALCSLSGKSDPRKLKFTDLRRQMRNLPKWYLRWKLGVFFGPNPKFANPAIKGKKDRERRYSEYLEDLLRQVSPASRTGSCMACGSRNADAKRVYREIHPLTGSGEFLNCFSFFERGLPLCSACVLAVQFAPFYMISKGGRLALVHSHNTRLMLEIARLATRYIKGLVGPGGELTFYAPGMRLGRRDEEFLVNLAYKVILPTGAQFGETSVRMYTFRNPGQDNELDYVDLPAQVFKFLEEASTSEFRWGLDELLQRSSPKAYSRLLSGQSIQLSFVNRKERRMIGGWQLFELYLKVVEEMDPKRIEAIRRVGERLYRYLTERDFKRLDDLEMAEDYQTFFGELSKIQRQALLWEIDDLPFLFPDKEGRVLWKETRHMLLGYVYELRHKEEEVRKS